MDREFSGTPKINVDILSVKRSDRRFVPLLLVFGV